MNRFQQKYCDTCYEGKKPKDKIGKLEFELLGNMKSNRIRVRHPAFSFPGFETSPERVEELVVNEECDIPNGKINVEVLASNLRFWLLESTEKRQIEYLV